jgi:hypothetical protein
MATPYELRIRHIYSTLAELGAIGTGVYPGPGGSEFSCYVLNGHPIILQLLPKSGGYEVYAPLVQSNSVPETIAALRKLAEVGRG